METLLFYILRTSIAAGILYLFYKLAVSRNTNHAYNRTTILFFVACSLLLPFFSINISAIFPQKEVATVPFDISQFNVTEITTLKPVAQIPWLKISAGFYFTGMLVTALIFLVSFSSMFFIILTSKKRTSGNGVALHVSDREVSPFSWMKFLVISREDLFGDSFAIIEHEKAHIRYHHSWDMLFANIYTVFFWFNPFAWLLRKELQTIHEYQADEMVIATGTDLKEYQLLLIRKCVGENKFMLANNFEYSHLHKRIKMIMKSQTKNSKRWIYSIIPLALIGVVMTLSIDKLQAKEPIEQPQSKTKVTGPSTSNNKANAATSNYELVNVGDKTIVSEKSGNKNEMIAVVNQLQGNVRCITINKQENGKESVKTNIIIRNDSTKLNEKPLFILDGKEIAENEISKIKPEDIENINVLKGESATAIYGKKGKNGVVIITSKQGAMDKVIISTKKMSEEDLKQDPLNIGKATVAPYSADALYILDGNVISYDEIKNINYENIESFSILKDKSATAMYGEKGKNGVVIITSKTGIKANVKEQKSNGAPISVSGIVTDENSKPIAGATVAISGSTKGTVTNTNGRFNIELNKGESLNISMVGKNNATIKFDKSTDNLKIILKNN